MTLGGDTGGTRRRRNSAIAQIELSEKDVAHFIRWKELSDDEKEAIVKLAKLFGPEEKRKSLYNLIEAAAKISEILAVHGHLGWAGRMFLKAGAIAGVLIAVATAYKVYFGAR